jgi:hypothetical protein
VILAKLYDISKNTLDGRRIIEQEILADLMKECCMRHMCALKEQREISPVLGIGLRAP